MSGPDYHHSSHIVCVVHVGILCDIPVLGMKYKNKRFELSVAIIKTNSWKCQCNGYYAVSVCLLRRVLFGFTYQHECP